ncbi:MAG TPA: FkbM family methyltransferase, partial [Longimicrobiaceae bacterium]
RYADPVRDRETARSAIRGWARGGGAGGPAATEVDAFLDERFRAETHTLPVRTLSSVIREEGIERIDLLKVDVEKSEYDVLRGIEDGHWPRIRQVVMEVDTDELLERVTALLGRHGFEWTVERDVTVREGSGEDAGEYVYLLYARRPGDAAAPARSAPPTAAELRAHLAARLPDFMVPSLFVFLESIPRTPGGKTDRRALPPPGAARAEPEAGYVEPRSALERTIAAVWREVLGVERVGARDNFFELGGTSVRLAAVHQALSARLDRPVTVVDLFRYPTVASLAEVLDAAPAGEEEVPEELERVQDRAERQRQARASSARLRGRANERR